MKSFNERKQIYLNELRTYSSFIKDNKNSEIMEILLNPKNEFELETANTYLGFIKDVVSLSIQIQVFNTELDVKNSAFAEYLTIVINTLNSEKTSEDKIKTFEDLQNDDGSFYAQVIYEMIVYSNNIDKIIAEAASRTGVDLNDELTNMRFVLEANKLGKRVSNELFKFSDGKCKYLLSFCNEFHNLCVNGLNKFNEDENLNDVKHI